MRILWMVAAALIVAAAVTLFVSDDTKISMILVIAGSAISLIDQYRERGR